MTDFEQISPSLFIDRLKRMADATGRHGVEDWREAKKARLDALDLSPAHTRLALAQQECPRIAEHVGSVDAATAAERFVSDPSLQLLVIGGPTGRGKTVAAAWVAATLDACWWISAKDARVGDEWGQARARAMKAGNLIVDDLGLEASEWAAKEVGSLIESRFDRGRRTLATTNVPPAMIAKVYGDRFASRMNQQGTGLYVVCGGTDLRRSK
jgi:hypothetical protein